MSHENEAKNERVLVLAPTSADRQLTSSILTEAGIAYQFCSNLDDVVDQFGESVEAVLLTDDALFSDDVRPLVEALENQPPWSDLPIILLSATGENSPMAACTIEWLGNVAVLERPVRLNTLVSALRSAIRDRRRQYVLRDQLESLRQSEERYRRLANLLPAAVYMCDTNGFITYYNRHAAKLWGRSPQPGDTDERFCGSDQMIFA